RAKGPFRPWVLGQLVASVHTDDLRRRGAAKRAGDRIVSLDDEQPADVGYDPSAAERAFGRGWAVGVLAEALTDADVGRRFAFAPALAQAYRDRQDVPRAELVALIGATGNTQQDRENSARGILLRLRAATSPVVKRL